MQDEYYIKHLGRDMTVKRAMINDFLSLRYRKVVNAPGRLDLEFNADHEFASNVEPLDVIEVWRRNVGLGIPWHRDFVALYFDLDEDTDESVITTSTFTGFGLMDVLRWRQIGFPAGVANRSSFSGVAAETVAKTLVGYNLTSLATVGNGRIRSGDLAVGMGFTVVTAADLGAGNVINQTFYNTNVLRAVTDVIQPIAGGDFDVILNGSSQLEFEFYPGQRGDDKRTGADRVEFSLSKGNMANPSYREYRSKAATAAIVAGQGVGDDRYYSVRTGADYAADFDIEMLVDARSEWEPSGADDMGDAALYDRRVNYKFDFDVIQTEATMYSSVPVSVPTRKTYKVGDLVTAFYKGVAFSRKVRGVDVDVQFRSLGRLHVTIDVETERV